MLIKNVHTVVTGYSNEKKELGIWLKENSSKDDYVYIIGTRSSLTLSYSDRVSSSKYINFLFVKSDVEKGQLLADLKTKPPVYFIRPDSYVDIGDKIEGFLDNNYTLLDKKYGHEILKLNSF